MAGLRLGSMGGIVAAVRPGSVTGRRVGGADPQPGARRPQGRPDGRLHVPGERCEVDLVLQPLHVGRRGSARPRAAAGRSGGRPGPEPATGSAGTRRTREASTRRPRASAPCVIPDNAAWRPRTATTNMPMTAAVARPQPERPAHEPVDLVQPVPQHGDHDRDRDGRVGQRHDPGCEQRQVKPQRVGHERPPEAADPDEGEGGREPPVLEPLLARRLPEPRHQRQPGNE